MQADVNFHRKTSTIHVKSGVRFELHDSSIHPISDLKPKFRVRLQPTCCVGSARARQAKRF